MGATRIPWATEVWNPATGCDPISEGCKFCYARSLAPRLAKMGQEAYAGEDPFSVRCHEDRLSEPLKWTKPRQIFVGSMTDMAHKGIPDDFRNRVFANAIAAPWHTYLFLTKRADELADYVLHRAPRSLFAGGWPRHIWLGFTAETQARFDERWEHMRRLAAIGIPTFVSIEPMLEPITLQVPVKASTGCELADSCYSRVTRGCSFDNPCRQMAAVRWVIVGGESAGSVDRRLVDRCPSCKQGFGGRVIYPPCPECNSTGWRPREWAREAVRSLRDQCAQANVPFFFKQWGGPTPRAGGANLDGRIHREIPEGMVSR